MWKFSGLIGVIRLMEGHNNGGRQAMVIGPDGSSDQMAVGDLFLNSVLQQCRPYAKVVSHNLEIFVRNRRKKLDQKIV